MVLWIFISCCQATLSLAWIVVWFVMSGLGFILQYTLIIMGHAVFEWLPMVVRFLYTAVLVTVQIAWQCVEADFQILASVWMFVYDINWRAAPAFGLALEVMNIMLWIISFCYEATLNLVWNIAWLLISAFLFVLQYTLIISGYVVFEWLPMLFRLIYSVAALLLYDLPWKLIEISVTIISTAWNHTSSTPVASILHQHERSGVADPPLPAKVSYTRLGRYTVREVSRINYDNFFEHLSETYALLLIALLVGIITCVALLIWHSQQKRSGRERSETSREREAQLRRGSEQRGRHSRSQSTVSHDAPEVYYTSEESTNSLSSDTELLRRQLQQVNMELSQERDRLLCVICQDLKREVVLKPCNHYCLCHHCLTALRECPICKSKILKTEKIYHA